MVSTSGPGEPPPTEVVEALVPAVVTGEGIDFEDYRDMVPKGLAAIFRFTGAVLRMEDLERIAAADLVFPISRH